MARFSCGFTPATAGSTTLPMASLIATTLVRPRLVEVGVFNTTTTGFTVNLQRFTTAGTAGAAQTASFEDDNSQTNVATVHTVYSSTAPTGAGVLRTAVLGAAVGAGVIWTFGGGKTPGLIIPNTTTDFIGIIGGTTPQVCAVYFVWDE
jgi:hypothetical protein